MRKGLGLLFSAVAALSLSALPIAAAAETTITGTGTFSFVSDTLISSQSADGNLISVHEQVYSLDSVMVGSELVDITFIQRPTGAFEEFYGTGTFTGNVTGVGTGTLQQGLSGGGLVPGVFSGQLVNLSGSGDLAGLQGVLDFQSPPPTYSVMFVKP
jgi:hypothetical protein